MADYSRHMAALTVSIAELEAERDRYREALEKIIDLATIETEREVAIARRGLGKEKPAAIRAALGETP